MILVTAYGSTETIIAREGADPETFGFGDEDNPDAALEEFITTLREQASSQVERYCGRTFGKVEEDVESLQGTGRGTISTRNYPVLEIHRLDVGAKTLDESQYQLVSTPGFDEKENSGRIELIGRRRFPSTQDVVITYDWGYEKPPAVVDGVVDDMVVEVLEKAAVDRASSAKSSESMDGYSVSWDNSDVQDYLTLTESMKERLRSLKRQGTA